MYKNFVTLTQENAGEKRRVYTTEGIEYCSKCDTLEHSKDSLNDIIWQAIEIDGLTGYVYVIYEIEKDGEYVDGEEFEIFIENVVRNFGIPSKYIIWGNKIPHIFEVNRDKSSFYIVDNLLDWNDLNIYEQAQAKEQYLCIRETEEQRGRDEITKEYPNPMDWRFVKECLFKRNEQGFIDVLI